MPGTGRNIPAATTRLVGADMRAAEFPLSIVRIACDHCGRSGVLKKATFVDKVGADTELPQALAIMALGCPHRADDLDPMRRKCRPQYVDDWW